MYNSYKSGYNCNIGGKAYNVCEHPSLGHKLSEEHKEKLKDSIRKTVSCFTIEGKYISTYKSAADAAESNNCDSSRILKVCKGKAHTCGGFRWRYGNNREDLPPIEKKKAEIPIKMGKDNHRSKMVYQYNLDYELVKIWECALQAEREEGFSSTDISKVCNGKKPFYGKRGQDKYIWSFIELDSSGQST